MLTDGGDELLMGWEEGGEGVGLVRTRIQVS